MSRMLDVSPEAQSTEGIDVLIVRQEAALFAQLEQLGKEESALRAYEARRARLCWDEDRRLEAEELGEKIGRKPAPVRAQLASTRHGALWLIGRWKALGAILDREPGWTDTQKSLAFDLLGVQTSLRSGEPWTSAGLGSPRALVDREIRGLEASLARTLDGLDDFQRKEAIEGCPVQPSANLRRVRREAAACWRRLLALQKVIFEETEKQLKLLRRAEAAPSPPPPPPGAAPPSEPARPVPAVSGSSPRVVATASLGPPPPLAGNRRARRAAQRVERRDRGRGPFEASTSSARNRGIS